MRAFFKPSGLLTSLSCCLIACSPSREQVESQLEAWLERHQEEWLKEGLRGVEERAKEELREKEKPPSLSDLLSQGKSKNPLKEFEIEGAALGNSDAPIQITVIASYLNSGSNRLYELIGQLFEKFGEDKIHVSFIFLPTPGVFEKREENAIRAVLAANKLSKFKEAHSWMSSKLGELEHGFAADLSKSIQVNQKTLLSNMHLSSITNYLLSVRQGAKANEIYFGPIVFINDYRLDHHLEPELFDQLISKIIKEEGHP